MRIGLIGGLTRNEAQLVKIAADAGHQLEFHTGETYGRGVGRLKGLVERSDFVIILTAINSHQAVWLAKQAAREFRRSSMVMRNCGQDSFRELMALLGQNRDHPGEVNVTLAHTSTRGHYKYHELAGL
jgi:hypothetical protein